MAEPRNVERVGMLAPMQPELQPIVRRLGLKGDALFAMTRPDDTADPAAAAAIEACAAL